MGIELVSMEAESRLSSHTWESRRQSNCLQCMKNGCAVVLKRNDTTTQKCWDYDKLCFFLSKYVDYNSCNRNIVLLIIVLISTISMCYLFVKARVTNKFNCISRLKHNNRSVWLKFSWSENKSTTHDSRLFLWLLFQ